MDPNCIQRTNTAVAPQALFLLNDTKIRTLADSLAQRIRNAVGDSLAEQVKTLCWLALSRPPSVDEERMILEELGRAYEARLGQPDETEHVLARLCHTIINSSAFMYVE